MNYDGHIKNSIEKLNETLKIIVDNIKIIDNFLIEEKGKQKKNSEKIEYIEKLKVVNSLTLNIHLLGKYKISIIAMYIRKDKNLSRIPKFFIS